MKLAKIASLWIDGPLSWLERASLASFVRLGHKVTLFTYGTVTNVPDGVIIRDAREIWDNDTVIVHGKAGSPAVHADIFRAIMVAETDLVWVDTDVVALRPFPESLKWFIGFEMEGKLSNAVMGVPKSAMMVKELAKVLTDPYPVPEWFNDRGRAEFQKRRDSKIQVDWGALPWGVTGPQALTYYAKKTGEIKHAQPEYVFFPVSFKYRKMLVDSKFAEEMDRRLEDEKVLAVHLYSRWMRKFTGGNLPKVNSWIGQYLLRQGLVSEDELPKPIIREKVKRTKAKGKEEGKINVDDFFNDLAIRKANFAGKIPPTRNGNLVAVTMAKDEGPYVLEWVAYHRLLGFSDILVYTNDCTDGTDEMLDALASLGLVTRVDNPPIGTKPPQSRALMRAQHHPLVTKGDWVMVFDFDEFVTIKRGESRVDDLVDMVKDHDAGAVAITWKFFGSDGNAHYKNQPVTARFLRSALPTFAKGFGVKTLFRMDKSLKLAIHRPHFSRQARKEAGHEMKWINGSAESVDGKSMSWRQTRQTVGYDFCQVNHYGVKSGEEFLMRRLRGDVLNNHGKYNDEYFKTFDRNDVSDHSVSYMQKPLMDLISELMTYPQIAAAAEIVRERYNVKLAQLRNSEGYHEQMRALGFV